MNTYILYIYDYTWKYNVGLTLSVRNVFTLLHLLYTEKHGSSAAEEGGDRLALYIYVFVYKCMMYMYIFIYIYIYIYM